MKSILTFLTLVFFGQCALAQHDLIPDVRSIRSEYFILDSFYHWGWDTTDFEWNLLDGALYTTDANQNVTSELVIKKDSLQQWANSMLTIYSFDPDNKETNELVQLWNGTIWYNSSQIVYTYDGDNNQTGILYQNWDGAAWTNSFNQVFTFDNNHNQLSRTSQHWSGTDWLDGTRQINTYNGSNHLTERLFQNWTGVWNDVSRSLYTYSINGDQDTILYQKWTFNAWNDDYRNIYTYDAHHNRLSIFAQLALGSNQWQDRDRYDYTYDQYDHITHLIYTKNVNDIWSNIYQYNLINDDDQNRATEVFQTWDNEWVNKDSTQYYYTGVLATHDFFEPQLITITPNPANDFIFVDCPEPINGTVAIYSLSGIKLLEFKSIHESSFLIKVESLTPGIYFVAFHLGDRVIATGFEKL